MELEVIELCNDLGYERKLDCASLEQLLQNWIEYSQILAWVSTELKAVTEIDETLNMLSDTDSISHLQMELNSILIELGCPYSLIMSVTDPKSRFNTTDKRLLALHFLLTELLSSRILYFEKKPQPMEIELQESEAAKLLKAILIDMGLGKPPDNITLPAIWTELKRRLGKVLPELKSAGISLQPIFDGLLSSSQWTDLEVLNCEFNAEYQIRREMLLKRLDVTIQSFNWSDRLASKRDTMSAIFNEHRCALRPEPSVKLSDILAAREDLAIVEKTSSASVRKNTKSAVNSVTIGSVPDRGGRPSETQAPEREMPSWQQRQAGSSGTVGWKKSDSGGSGGYRGNRRGDNRQSHSGRGGGATTGTGGHYDTNEGYQQRGGRGYGGRPRHLDYQQEQGHGGYQGDYHQQDGGGSGPGGYQNDYQHRQGGYQDSRGYQNDCSPGHGQGGFDQFAGGSNQRVYYRGGGRRGRVQGSYNS